MIILSVDYGDSRTGIAVCDALEMLASPVCVIEEGYAPKLIKRIADICKDKRAELIVVGYPINMDSSEGERAKKCKELASLISEEISIKTVLWDERLTTVSAHMALNMTNTRGKKRKAVVDAVAATMILQDYLDYRRNANEE
ncbi:MAG: Holliday junction resolvase RuvX [Clostridiales bacterium]|nr:Holliday junction resolvase RuvX [Clostridiales bacterium]